MATTATDTRPSIAHKQHPDPTWNDAQRTAWEAARAIYDAKEVLWYAYEVNAIPSQEPCYRAWLAWNELEREIAPLFAEEEVK